jgi:Chaperone of endosialidase
MKLRMGWAFLACFGVGLSALGQSAGNTSVSASVPPLIQFSNVATDSDGNTLSGAVSITFSLYAAQQGGEPLWTETQNNVQLDATGHYSVQLGITQPNGVPTALFTTGAARWLGVQIADEAEQPRVLLLSVPYALKAGDAATVGGLPPSAFVLAATPTGSATPAVADSSALGSSLNSAASSAPPSGAVTGTGTVDYLPMWDSTSDIISSVLYQSGTGSAAKIGINTNKPASTLDVKGGSTIRGPLSLPAVGVATASKGANSQPITQVASAYNSSTSTAVNQSFQWQAEPFNNDMSNAGATLNLLFGQGTSKPAETGLHIASNGEITFATGQTFPGLGTVTSVGSGPGLTGGPITSSGTLQIDPTVVPELGAASNAFAGSVSASSFSGSGAGLVNVNAALLNGLPSSAFQAAGSYATLGANTFTATQTVTGNLALPLTNSGGTQGVISIGGSPFLQNYDSTGEGTNTFVGQNAGNLTTSGTALTATGSNALANNSSGEENTADGLGSLFENTTGSGNTAMGWSTLQSNQNGSDNTAVGALALLSTTSGSYNSAVGQSALTTNLNGTYNSALGYNAGNTTNQQVGSGSNNSFFGAYANPGTQANLSNATAIGAYSQVSESNAMVLGPITGTNNCTASNNCASVNVGIGTTAPAYALDVYGTGHFTQAVTFGTPVNFASGQTFPGTGTITSVSGTNGITGSGTSGSVTLGLASNTCASGNALSGLPFVCSPFATLGANTFTNSQTVNGNLTATGVVSGSSFQIGSSLFAYGSLSAGNAFLGFAGNTTMTGGGNTASGFDAFLSNVTGVQNAAIGDYALAGNTTGSYNTAVGGGSLFSALGNNTTGSSNTGVGAAAGDTSDFSSMTGGDNAFLGANASASTGTLTNATAIGANSEVSESNAMVLGSIEGVNYATASTNVGIGTTVPAAALHINGPAAAPPGSLPASNNGLLLGSNGTSSYKWVQTYGGPLTLNPVGNDVGIGTETPDALLSVNGGADKPGGGSWGTFSDRRLKNLDGSFSSGLSQIMNLNPVLYRYKEGNGMGIQDHDEHVGLVAQDVQKVIPEAVTENSRGYLLVNNDPIIWAMLNAIKQQQKQIAAEQSLIRKQQRLVSAEQRLTNAQQHEIARLSRKLGALEVSLRTASHAQASSVLASR